MKTISEKLVSEWSSRNEFDPKHYSGGSNKKVWWVCEKGHEWKASINNRVNGRGCPYCVGRKVCEDNCLTTTHPELIGEWHPKNEMEPSNFTKGSGKKVWWICQNGHEWMASIRSRTRKGGSGCGYCSGKFVCDENRLSTNYPHLINEWDFSKNKTPPNMLSYGSNKEAWWVCKNGHKWKTQISNRTIGGKNCPQCVSRKLSPEKCLEQNLPLLVKQWHPKNELKPDEVFLKSNKKVWWICENGHEWIAAIADRTHNNQGCPYCVNQKICEDNCLATTHPDLIKEWSDRNKTSFFEISFGSRKVFWWKCQYGHEWKDSVAHRTGEKRNCPVCFSQSSKISQEWLDFLGVEKHKRERRIVINNKTIKADAFCEKENMVYEFDGDFWHGNPKIFDPNDINPKNQKTYGELYRKTLEKRNLITSAGYNLTFIWESDWKNKGEEQ